MLSDPTRRELLQTIAERPEATATELASAMPISRQAVVKHLTALADAGLVDRARTGREVRYHVTPEPLRCRVVDGGRRRTMGQALGGAAAALPDLGPASGG